MKLLDNGKYFLKKSINTLNDLDKNILNAEYEYKLKDIVINLHQSIETIFKYMIKEKNEFLVYSNCEEVFKERVMKKFNGNKGNIDIKTIQFLDAVYRVVLLYDVDFKKEDYNKFDKLNNIRNSLTHFEREFSDNEIEHLIASILPVLLKIFKENIKSFDSWVKINGIYLNENTIERNALLWLVKQYYIFEEKWLVSKRRVETLNINSKDKSTIFSHKNNTINYIKCPLCNNDLFHATGTYIVNADEVVYLGECEYCKISINKLDARFISSKYDGFNDYDIYGVSKMKYEIIEVLMSEHINIDLNNIKDTIISTIISNKDDLIESLKIKIKDKIHYICDRVAESYFESKIYPDGYINEHVPVFKHSVIDRKLIDCRDYIIIDDKCNNIIKNISNTINKISSIDEELADTLKDCTNGTYISYHQEIYKRIYFEMLFDGEDIESKITFKMKFNYTDVIERFKSI